MKVPKMLKVSYMGSPLCQIYPHATKWQVFKYRLAIFMRKVLIASFLLGAIYGAFHLGRTTTEPVFVQAEDKSQAMYDAKIEELKNQVIEQLAKCESGGKTEDDGLIVFDTNKVASLGVFQWQVASLKHYYKLMTGKDITSKEAILIALDKEEASKLVKYVAFETKNMIGKDWVVCNQKHGLDMQVSFIKSML